MSIIRLPEQHLKNDNPLASLEPFLGMLGSIAWFGHTGEPLNSQQRCLGVDYLAAMGFGDCSPVYLSSWEEAADACMAIDGESAWRQEEARQMESLTEAVLDRLEDRNALLALLTEMTAALSRVIPACLNRNLEAAEQEEALRDAAFGSAVYATQMAALMLMAQQFDTPEALDHPAATRFQLFELGHWPIGLVGRSFMVL